MISPSIPENEKERQLAVEKYHLLDTLVEDNYDNITEMIASICETPISLITLLDKDRNFLKSHHGIPFNESPRNISFCGHAINSDEKITIVEDSRKDERFYDNPLVTEQGALFYAGAPLVDSSGFKLGTLCVYDTKPRVLLESQKRAIITMSKQVVNLFEQRYQNFQLQKFQTELKTRNEDLQSFAVIVSHDLKSPLANIITLTQLLEDDNGNQLNTNSKLYLKYLKNSSSTLTRYIDGLLEYYRSDELSKDKKSNVSFQNLIQELKDVVDAEQKIELTYSSTVPTIEISKPALMQILLNLTVNAIKYNSTEDVKVDFNLTEDDDYYFITVEDNGDGIDKSELHTIFDLFSIAVSADKYGKRGTGIGLATVKKITENINGTIEVSSVLGTGTKFNLSFPKNTL